MDCPQPDEEKLSPPETTLVAVSDFSLLDRIFSYSHLQRVTAWILRFCHQFSRQSGTLDEGSSTVSAKELTDAEMFYIYMYVKMTQLVEFSHEISTSKAGKELTANSKILMLRSFLDQQSLPSSQRQTKLVKSGIRDPKPDHPSW